MNGHSHAAVNQPDEDPLLAEHEAKARRLARARKEKEDEAVASFLLLVVICASIGLVFLLAGCVLAKH